MVNSTYIRIPLDLHKPLKVLAAQRGTSMSQLVAKLIKDELGRTKKEQ